MPEDREHYDDDDDNEDATMMTTKCWCNSSNEKKQNWYQFQWLPVPALVICRPYAALTIGGHLPLIGPCNPASGWVAL